MIFHKVPFCVATTFFVSGVSSFTFLSSTHTHTLPSMQSTYSQLSMSTTTNNELLTLSLEKPLGMILEEVEENAPMGVKVEELSDAGSAYASPYRDTLIGLKVAEVMGEDCRSLAFDDVMDKLINAPSPVSIGLEPLDGITSTEPAEPISDYDIGTIVTLKVLQEGEEPLTISDARVGDNLRKTLLDNNVELYRGLKKKLGNCGGGGQCTFCAVDFVEDECDGWLERSEYEDSKIPKYPTARLACLNNIMGPATIRVQ